MKFEIKNRGNGAVLYSTEISAKTAGMTYAVQLGFFIKKSVKERAYLQGADLQGADLQGADLRGVKNLEEAKDFRLAIAQTRILPDEGSVVGWKKCNGNVIVKLLIPAEAKRSHAFGRKCRAEYADVLEVFGAVEGVTSQYGPKTIYRAGERVKPTSFHPNWMDECAPGIHFFITREEAEAYS